MASVPFLAHVVHVAKKNRKSYFVLKIYVLLRNKMNMRSLILSVLVVVQAATSTAIGAGLNDPFSTQSLVPQSPAKRQICKQLPTKQKAFSLVDVVEFSLCNNPQTHESWAAARAQAAILGSSESAWLPTISIQASGTHEVSRTNGSSFLTNQKSASLSASYLLYDFGGRSADIENARQLLIAANATADAAVQDLFLNAVKAYFGTLSAEASVKASLANEASAKASLKAAETQVKTGTATPADELQAKTAYAQSVFNRIQAQGNERIARGVLANVMGIMPTDVPLLQPLPDENPNLRTERDINQLIKVALKQRPDLTAADAQVKAAQAIVESSKASGMPSITLNGSITATGSAPIGGITTNTGDSFISINLSFPLFTGFDVTYRVHAADAQVENSMAARRRLANLVTQQVWQAYQNLRTQGQALRSARTLLASAKLSNNLNLGRYKAGVGTILEVLSSQSALASAREQHIRALYNWHIARFSLAQAIGMLDLTALPHINLMEQ